VNTVYRLCNAFLRALFVLLGVIAVGLAAGGAANADEPTPRAIPQARAYPRTFSSYDTLIAYATAVAADQNALDAQVAAVRLERNALSATLSTDGAGSGRGGRLFDPDARRDARSAMATASARVSDLVSLDKKITAAGALTTPSSPWRMPTDGHITQPFGPTSLWVEPARVFEGVSYAHFHEGVDVAGVWAADVVAPARGRVVFVGRMMDGAEVVVLAHDGGVVTMYAHLNNTNLPPTVTAGDEVAAGQKLGTQGLTGMITGMHLHWAAWRGGQLIDPMSLIGH
jgi:murein DD-endopeptidase MepM/ murein hydrolase activator NlpD